MTAAINPNRHVALDPACGGYHDLRMAACPNRPDLLPERFAVEVTADDIAQGWPCNASQCPIALAVMRWLWEQNIPVVYVSVTDRDVEINLDWRTPALRYWHDAASFTTTYDRAEPVEPRTVVLARLPR
jgi:hypothetical protein